MNLIKVDIDAAKGTISVWNNGGGIPIEIHKEHGCYVPELIFGNSNTQTNNLQANFSLPATTMTTKPKSLVVEMGSVRNSPTFSPQNSLQKQETRKVENFTNSTSSTT